MDREFWNKVIVAIGILASIITIFVFVSGKSNIYEIINTHSSGIPEYKRITDDDKQLKSGIYVQLSSIRKFPTGLQSVLLMLLNIFADFNDVLYIVDGNQKTVFLKQEICLGSQVSEEPFKIRYSIDQSRFLVMFPNTVHIANINGSCHTIYQLQGSGEIENIAFVKSKKLRFNIHCDKDDERAIEPSKSIVFGPFTIRKTGTYEADIDENNMFLKGYKNL